DVIGSSYYPFWTKKTVAEFVSFAGKVLDRYPGKEMMVMETGYAWNPTLPSGYPGQLKDNGPYPAMTKEGQKAFMKELIDGIRSDGRILGFLYWDPIFIEVPGIGWELGAGNVVSNTTLFDFEGNALPVFEAFRQ
ncbi:MAG: glycosyl hydrolase 53 family protein, partial [Bacteroidales bacterium]|nr:glycosyl hydrolase 53 family protein [Bacteroidales bacterium]